MRSKNYGGMGMEKIFKRGEKEITALSWDAIFSCGGRQEKVRGTNAGIGLPYV